LSRKTVGRKASYIYIETVIEMFVGYILWLLLSRITTPDVIGISSTVISLAIIFSVIADLGVSRGSTRFLGRSFSEEQMDVTKALMKAALLLVCSGMIVCSIAILALKDWIYPNISDDLVLTSILLLSSIAISFLLRSTLIASLQTRTLPIIMILSSIIKVVLTIILVLLGAGAIGITVGSSSAYLSAAILYSFSLVTILKPFKQKSLIPLRRACKIILLASVAGWLPRVITVLGSRFGTIIVFGIEGASYAGFYFIAFSIFYAISAIPSSFFSVLFPMLSAMDDNRKRFVWQMIKLSLVVTLPISSAVTAYSNEIMGLFGWDYVQASMSLKVMLYSMFGLIFSTAIETLVYSYGNYRLVLAVGLGTSISRIFCYFILVPLYGITGAAIGFTIGSIVGFAVSAVVAKRLGFLLFWKELALLFIIPSGISLLLEFYHVDYFVGIPMIFSLSLMLFLALRVLSRSEIRETLTLLPDRIGRPLISILNKL
jgi:O-antigen/teichoic acid export membrane protein